MRRVVFSSVFAIGLMAATYAQEPAKPATPATPATPTVSPASPATPATPSPQSAKPEDAKAVVVTGCVGGGPAAFTLTNVMASATAKPGEKPIGTAGVSSSYDLTARAGVDLAPHIGHKVEITGTPMEASVTGSIGGGAVSTDKPAAGARTPTPKLSVSAVKMVSASCP